MINHYRSFFITIILKILAKSLELLGKFPNENR